MNPFSDIDPPSDLPSFASHTSTLQLSPAQSRFDLGTQRAILLAPWRRIWNLTLPDAPADAPGQFERTEVLPPKTPSYPNLKPLPSNETFASGVSSAHVASSRLDYNPLGEGSTFPLLGLNPSRSPILWEQTLAAPPVLGSPCRTFADNLDSGDGYRSPLSHRDGVLERRRLESPLTWGNEPVPNRANQLSPSQFWSETGTQTATLLAPWRRTWNLTLYEAPAVPPAQFKHINQFPPWAPSLPSLRPIPFDDPFGASSAHSALPRLDNKPLGEGIRPPDFNSSHPLIPRGHTLTAPPAPGSPWLTLFADSFDAGDEYRSSPNRRNVDKRRKLDPPLVFGNESFPKRAQDMPAELLLMVVKYAISDAPELATLRSLALVCRAWLQLCAPVLHHRIHVHSSRIQQFSAIICAPGCRMIPHVTRLRLTIENPFSCVGHLNNISKFLARRLTILDMGSGSGSGFGSSLGSSNNMQYSRILSGVCATFSNVTYFRLTDQSLSSSMDLLRLFGALPALTEVELERVTWDKSPVLVPHHRLSKLSTITCCRCTSIWPFLLCAAWSHPSDTLPNGVFGGLSSRETYLAARICECTKTGTPPDTGRIHIQGSASARTYTISIWFWTSEMLELHIQQAENMTQAGTSSAYIRWVVFRDQNLNVNNAGYFKSLEAVLLADEYLSQLPHLEKVVLETRDASGSMQAAGYLTSVAHSIHQWTSQDAAEFAKEAYKHGAPPNSQLPASPYWYADVFESERKRLKAMNYVNID